jgi:cell pole-organizing protein PopZ
MMSKPEKQEASIEQATGVLVANEVSNAVHSMFTALQQKIVVDKTRTLEDLTREMLRPMLKSWLDENLPRIVERLVRAEIDRVSPQPRPGVSSP